MLPRVILVVTLPQVGKVIPRAIHVVSESLDFSLGSLSWRTFYSFEFFLFLDHPGGLCSSCRNDPVESNFHLGNCGGGQRASSSGESEEGHP